MRTYNSNRKLSTKMLLLTIMFSLLAINTLTTQFTLVAGDIGDDDWTMFRHDPAHIGYSTSTAPTTNQTQWTYTLGDSVDYSSPAIADTALYVGSWDDKLYCFNATTGVFIWSFTTEDDIRSSPAVADDKVYVGSDDNKIYCINATTGAHIWNTTTGDNIRSSQ